MAAVLEENFDLSDVAEVHWSANTILAIFFASSLISAVFFGLGYSFGRGGTAKSAMYTASSATISSPGTIGEQTQQQPASNVALRNAVVPTPATPIEAVDTHRVNDAQQSVPAALRPVSSAPSPRPKVVPARDTRPVPTAEQHSSAVRGATADGAGRYMVQVGAVGDRKDARMLVSQLRKRGFHAGIYSAKNDKFLHVQIGPFTGAQQAQTMRHHVLASGYHAILKRAS